MTDQSQSRIDQAVQRAVERWVPDGAAIVVAVSGGPDSVALLRSLHQFTRGNLIVAHFDHRFRVDSAADAQFVRHLAETLQLPFELGHASEGLLLSEENARNARYPFLAEVAARHHANWVATGHTEDDQVETILHSILRGTGLRGLSGMPVVRPLNESTNLIRPLLDVSRQSVHDYLLSLSQDFCLDATNTSPDYTRNRLRHQLLPLLRAEFNPAVDAALLRLAKLAQLGSTLVEDRIEDLLDAALLSTDSRSVELRLEQLESASDLELGELFRHVLRQRNWPLGRIGLREAEYFIDVVRGVASARDLPDGLRVERLNSRRRGVPRVVISRD